MRIDHIIGVLIAALVILAAIMSLRTRTRKSMVLVAVSIVLLLVWMVVIQMHIF